VARTLRQEAGMSTLFVLGSRGNGPFADRSSPEFLTLVAVVIGLGAGIVVQALRRRAARR
jgi:hypothetical protein